MSSLELIFDDLKKDYNNNICKIGTETKEGHFLKNGNIKLNQQIDYMYLYKRNVLSTCFEIKKGMSR